jgi:hypothetical protein
MRTTEARRRENARKNASKATRARHKRTPIEMDWDKAIALFKAMLDDLEAK